MAKAEKKYVKVLREEEVGVTLELSKREAAALAVVLAHIAGDARTTARGETDRIARALDATGYSYRKLTDAWGYHPTDPIPNERELRYGRLIPSLTLRRPIPQEWA